MYKWNEEYTEQELEEEIRFANLMRSLDAIIYSWENDALEIEDMTRQLEMACGVLEGKVEYKQMINELDMRDLLYL